LTARLELVGLFVGSLGLLLREAGVLTGPSAQHDQQLVAQRRSGVRGGGDALVYGRGLVSDRVEVAGAVVDRGPLLG
jgi:hypothetical protein